MSLDLSVIATAFSLAASVAGVVLAAIVLGSLAAGILKTATQIDDPAISFFFRLLASVIALYVFYPRFSAEVLQFSSMVLGNQAFYQ